MVKNLKVVLTASVQGNLCYLFLPYSPEGESFRWDVAISPAAPGLDISRPDKLVKKDGTFAVLKALLGQQIMKILGHATAGNSLVLDSDARAVGVILEKCAKVELKKFCVRKGSEVAGSEPIYAYLRGKRDSKYMTHLTSIWAMSESWLSFLNQRYQSAFSLLLCLQVHHSML